MGKLRILVFGNHPVVREGVVSYFSPIEGYQVIGEAENLAEAVKKASTLEPELVMIDFHLQNVTNAFEAGAILQQVLPNARIMLYGSVGVAGDASARAGGYPVEAAGQAAGELRETSGSMGAEARVKRRSGRRQLTRTEQKIAYLVMKGYKNKAIASSLFISVNTVKSHIQSIFRKVDAENRAELIKILLADPTLMGLEQPHLELSGQFGAV